jgi:hypothetical protein
MTVGLWEAERWNGKKQRPHNEVILHLNPGLAALCEVVKCCDSSEPQFAHHHRGDDINLHMLL